MIAEQGAFLVHLSARRRTGTTMSNFNLRLLPTFSVSHRGLSEGALSNYLNFSIFSKLPKKRGNNKIKDSKLTSKVYLIFKNFINLINRKNTPLNSPPPS